ncbi:MAG: NCS1 family nucleobase:cation symporter-1 [Rhodothermales bacterium]|nr:NCS1 family nucleobase:cation symporter-1 [Rhodothermales bacterium]MBO6779956.1 NCS1 family nucleobase:cation symporter-1 [Rhodothermales bacterium]
MSASSHIPNKQDIVARDPKDPSPSLYNPDLAPVLAHKRSWGRWNIAALWVGMAVCIPTYTLAAGLISQGMTWTQALFTILLGNLIVLIPMVLNAHAGTRYGIPFPVLLRASFGTVGANVPALMRALVACGWFGIQTWIGGSAIYTLHAVIFGFEPAGPADMLPVIGLSWGQLGCFLLFWAINIAVILAGIDTIKWLETLAAPFLILIGLGLLYWGISAGGGLGAILSAETVAQVRGSGAGDFNFWAAFWPNLTAMVGFWATLSLNIPDFTRYAYSQKDQITGQVIGLPLTMTLFSFIGIAVTAATVIVFGEAVWDPVILLGRFESPVLIGFALFALTIATLSTNIAANVVSPANDFANLAPSKISFRTGGLITGVIGILIFPWKLYTDLANYIFMWLIGYSSLLGAIGGVMLVDYFLVRGMHLSIDHLYSRSGTYSYGGRGFNWRALAALAIGILPNVPGFLASASGGSIAVPDFFVSLYTYAWFVSLMLSGIAYLILMRAYPPERS